MEYLKEKAKLVSIVTKAIKDHDFSIQDFKRLLKYRVLHANHTNNNGCEYKRHTENSK